VALAAILTSGAPAQSLGDVATREEARRKGHGQRQDLHQRRFAGAPRAARHAGAAGSEPRRARRADQAAPAPRAEDRCKPPTADAKAEATPRPADRQSRAPAGSEGRPGHVAQAAPVDPGRARSRARRSPRRSRAASTASRPTSPRATIRHSAPASANDRQKALTEMDRVKKEIADHTKALADLQEEARKAGVPPGWLR
jgi:hypothetical protein